MFVNFVVHLDYKAVYMRVYFPFSLSLDMKGKMLSIYDLAALVLLIDTFLCRENAVPYLFFLNATRQQNYQYVSL